MNSGNPVEIPDPLAARAALHPDRAALMVDESKLSFCQLDARATVVASHLRRLGVRPGDRVATLLPNGEPLSALIHGAGRAGATLVPLNIRLSPVEIAWQAADVRPRILLCDRAMENGLEGVRREAPSLPLHQVETLGGCESAFASSPPPAISMSYVHTIIYTSGTTGRPKGTMLTYGNHWWSAIGSALNLGLHDDDCWLAPLPLFHVGGMSILIKGAIYGMPVIVHRGFDPRAVNRAIDEDGVTIVSVVATMLRRMLEERGERPYPSTLRHVLLGGGPVPPSLLEECLRRRLPVIQTYGLTETCSQAATLSPADALRKTGSAGRPLLHTSIRIERDGEVLGADDVGEIVVRGPTVTPGYADRPEETRRAIRDGWLHTGDLGRLDDEGYLYVLDRRDDLIISGGENVYPAEIEAALLTHPSVLEAGVVGAEDERWGQVPVAYVVPAPDVPFSRDALLHFVGERLARYKVPARVLVVEELPRNASGKLLRRDLPGLVASPEI